MITGREVYQAFLDASKAYVKAHTRKGKPVRAYTREYVPVGTEVTGPWEIFMRARPDGTFGGWITATGRLVRISNYHNESIGIIQGKRESMKKWIARLEEFAKKKKLIRVQRAGSRILFHYLHKLTSQQEYRMREFRMAYKSTYRVEVLNTKGLVEGWSKLA